MNKIPFISESQWSIAYQTANDLLNGRRFPDYIVPQGWKYRIVDFSSLLADGFWKHLQQIMIAQNETFGTLIEMDMIQDCLFFENYGHHVAFNLDFSNPNDPLEDILLWPASNAADQLLSNFRKPMIYGQSGDWFWYAEDGIEVGLFTTLSRNLLNGEIFGEMSNEETTQLLHFQPKDVKNVVEAFKQNYLNNV